MASKYFHTLSNEPAFFSPRDQAICYVCGPVKLREFLVADLKTIRKQQAISRKTRAAQEAHFNVVKRDLNYVRVTV